MVKHFLKTLLIFSGMILIGLIGVILVNYYDEKNQKADVIKSCPPGQETC